MSNWQTESIRLTTFHKEVIDVKKIDWWQEVFGHDAEVSETKPATMMRTESAELGNGRLFLVVAGNKVDWQFAAPINLFGEERAIGSIQEAYDGVASHWVKWLQTRSDVVRIAFGGVAVIPVDGRVTGYKVLQDYLHCLKLDPENSRDLSYRINRPRVISIDDAKVTINRVMSWSVQRLAMAMNFQSGAVQVGNKVTETYRVACEVDINTDAERTETFAPEKLPEVLKSLCGLGVEIVEKGDIP